MRTSFSSVGAVAFGAAALGLGAQATAQLPGPCWDTNLGTPLTLTDDSLSTGHQLPFQFPLPGGGTTNLIDICSNGFVWLVSGSSTSTDYSPTVAELLSEPQRIAAVWNDLNPANGGTVSFNASPTSAVITWDQVPEYSNNGINTVQIQLFPDGSFSVAIREMTRPGTHDTILGITAGNGTLDPGEIDYSILPYLTNGVSTVYEHFDYSAEPRDIVGRTYYYIPDGGGGYIVVEVPTCRAAGFSTFGAGCPKPPVVYEMFTSGTLDLSGTAYDFMPNGAGGWVVVPSGSTFNPNFSNNLALTDDALAVGQALGFTFPMPGSPSVSTTSIDVCSNGFVWLVSGASTSYDLSPSAAEFLNESERIAALWQDLNPGSTSGGGGVYFDALPGMAMVTWDQVPEFGTGGAPNTVQLQMFPTGMFSLVFVNVSNATHDALVGYSPGNGAEDPGPVDYTAMAPFSTGAGGHPVEHTLGAGQLPRVGSTVNLDLAFLPSAASVAFMNFGFYRLNIDLTTIGMPGCFLLSSGEAMLPMNLGPASTASVAFTIPNNPAFVGVTVITQGLVVAPGSTAMNVVTSNGGVLDIGV